MNQFLRASPRAPARLILAVAPVGYSKSSAPPVGYVVTQPMGYSQTSTPATVGTATPTPATVYRETLSAPYQPTGVLGAPPVFSEADCEALYGAFKHAHPELYSDERALLRAFAAVVPPQCAPYVARWLGEPLPSGQPSQQQQPIPSLMVPLALIMLVVGGVAYLAATKIK